MTISTRQDEGQHDREMGPDVGRRRRLTGDGARGEGDGSLDELVGDGRRLCGLSLLRQDRKGRDQADEEENELAEHGEGRRREWVLELVDLAGGRG